VYCSNNPLTFIDPTGLENFSFLGSLKNAYNQMIAAAQVGGSYIKAAAGSFLKSGEGMLRFLGGDPQTTMEMSMAIAIFVRNPVGAAKDKVNRIKQWWIDFGNADANTKAAMIGAIGGRNAFDVLFAVSATKIPEAIRAVRGADEVVVASAEAKAPSLASTDTGVPEWKGPADYSSVESPANVNSSTRPTPRQVREMKVANQAQNDGVLRDDSTGELMVDSAKSQSGVTPPSNEAQVDHIIPSSKGGTRTTENLQLLTRENNRAKANSL
jgi:hypothetical protein